MNTVKGIIEEIGRGHGGYQSHLNGTMLWKETPDTLYLSNGKPNLWILSLFTGYRQIGCFEVKRPHDFKEGQEVIITLNGKGKVVRILETMICKNCGTVCGKDKYGLCTFCFFGHLNNFLNKKDNTTVIESPKVTQSIE